MGLLSVTILCIDHHHRPRGANARLFGTFVHKRPGTPCCSLWMGDPLLGIPNSWCFGCFFSWKIHLFHGWWPYDEHMITRIFHDIPWLFGNLWEFPAEISGGKRNRRGALVVAAGARDVDALLLRAADHFQPAVGTGYPGAGGGKKRQPPVILGWC